MFLVKSSLTQTFKMVFVHHNTQPNICPAKKKVVLEYRFQIMWFLWVSRASQTVKTFLQEEARMDYTATNLKIDQEV